MKPLEIVLAFGVLAFLLVLAFGSGAYWQSKRLTLPDTVRTVEYVKVPVQVGVATPKPVTRYVRDTVFVEVRPEGVLVPADLYDSLTVRREWEIDGEYIGHLDLGYDPIERILTYTHTPPPMKIETVQVTQEVPVSFWKKLEYIGYGVAGGLVLGIALGQ